MNVAIDNQQGRRVEALLQKMTLAQKIGQMVQAERMAISPAEVRDWHIGSVLSGAGSCPGNNELQDWVEMNDAWWGASMDADAEHLAIPVLFGLDAIHGNGNVRGATVFPHNIGLGAANDPDLIERIGHATAKEVLAAGADWVFAPTLAVAGDIRWGRTYESFGEDPELVSNCAAASVRGLQGDLGRDAVVACAKHWVGDGGTTHGIEQGDTRVSEQTLRDVHVTPYLRAIDAGVLTIMVSFNSWNGEKCHGHRYLIDYLLKREVGFRGCTVSDWDGIDYLSDNYFDAVAMGVNAGIDLFMISQHWQPFIHHLTTHVARGNVSMARIDDAVRRILGVKFAFGLFDKPRPACRHWSGHTDFGSAAHRALAREAVRKSLVLLKNEGNVLPLSPTARILVAGRNAHNRGHQCGGFTIAWQGTSGNDEVTRGASIWEAVRECAPGAVLSSDGSGREANGALHDVALVVIGENPYAEGMGDIRAGENLVVQTGSRINGKLKVLECYGATNVLAELHPEDLATITRIRESGVPVVTLMVCGRPLVTNQELDASAAFAVAWLPGSEGAGIADVLFGAHDFSGRLSFPWPRSPGGPGADILYPTGYGLGA